MNDEELFIDAKKLIENGDAQQASQILLLLVEQYPESKHFSSSKILLSTIDELGRRSLLSWSDSLVCFSFGFLSFVFSLVFENSAPWIILSVPGVMYGYRALSKHSKNNIQLGGYSLIVFGLVLSVGQVNLYVFELLAKATNLAILLSSLLLIILLLDFRSIFVFNRVGYGTTLSVNQFSSPAFEFKYGWPLKCYGYLMVLLGILGIGLWMSDGYLLFYSQFILVTSGFILISTTFRVLLRIDEEGMVYKSILRSKKFMVKNIDIRSIEIFPKEILIHSGNTESTKIPLGFFDKNDRYIISNHCSFLHRVINETEDES